MKTIPLEDNFADVLSKASRGSSLEVSTLAERSGLEADKVKSVLGGKLDEAAVRKLAPVLGLGAERVVALGKGDYHPAPVKLEGLASFNVPFDDMTVNYYLAWDAATKEAVAFDTGTDCDGILEKLRAEGLTLKLILLTHSHGDHIYDLDRLKDKTGAPAWIGEKEPIEGADTFKVGQTFQVGGLQIETRSTWGHSRGGVTYVVHGLARPVAVVGDALFAGSMGGGGVSYEAALKTNREGIFTLPNQTVICPGHGPLTTVGEQKQANPFFPEFTA
jgi:hydroxyacylglutathione hydrolase